MTSYKPEVLVDGTWSRNGLVFATHKEAHENAKDLMNRWLKVDDVRVAPVEESEYPVNYSYHDRRLVAVTPAETKEKGEDSPTYDGRAASGGGGLK